MKCWIGRRGNENTQRESQMNTATEWRDFSKSLHQKKLILYSHYVIKSACNISVRRCVAYLKVFVLFFFYIPWNIALMPLLQISFLD